MIFVTVLLPWYNYFAIAMKFVIAKLSKIEKSKCVVFV